MIGKLRGVVDSYGEDFLILDVHGVGYAVQCSSRTLQALPRPGESGPSPWLRWIDRPGGRIELHTGMAGTLALALAVLWWWRQRRRRRPA